LAIQPRCSLAALEPLLLRHPLSVLNLTVRAFNCLAHVPSISALLDFSEVQLMRQRHFGRTSLADVRRKMVHFCVDHLGVGVAHPIRLALYDPHPAVVAVWNTPPQPRRLGDVVDELLDVLSRPEELRAAGVWCYSARAIGPPRQISLDAVSLEEVIDSFFQPLQARERRMVELRYGPLDGAGATLAEIGAEFGLTRERVRQILYASLLRLATEGERRRRQILTAFLSGVIERAGGLILERDLVAAIRQRLLPPYPDCGAFLRAFLDAEPGCMAAGRAVWATADVSLDEVAALRETFRAALRAAGQPLHRDELLGISTNGSGYAPAFLLGCLVTDERLSQRDGDRFGLVEWEWLLPHSLDDYIYLALRAADRPRHYLWITEYVNSLVAAGAEVTSREVHSALLERTERFQRVREGTYGLVEAGSSPAPAASARPRGEWSYLQPPSEDGALSVAPTAASLPAMGAGTGRAGARR
jgi:Sigma-70, region 4/Bacterial RNA polymerase, alpha chain C terminal domain